MAMFISVRGVLTKLRPTAVPTLANASPQRASSTSATGEDVSTEQPQKPAEPPSTVSPDETFTLPSGDVIGYSICGPADAPPLFFFHGFPSSRLEGAALDEYAQRIPVRIISPDRPGLGLSTFDPNRTLLDYPHQISALAKHLGYKNGYRAIGGSGGGPYALACAKVLPKSELTSVGVLAGIGPMDTGEGTKGMRLGTKLYINSVKYYPGVCAWLVKKFMGEKARDPDKEKFHKFMTKGLDLQLKLAPMRADEKEMLMKDDAKAIDIIVDTLREHLRQGERGMVQEGQVVSRYWGFRLEDVEREGIRFYYGSDDINTPAATGRAMVAKLKNAHYHEYPGETHMTLFERYGDEILKDMLKDD